MLPYSDIVYGCCDYPSSLCQWWEDRWTWDFVLANETWGYDCSCGLETSGDHFFSDRRGSAVSKSSSGYALPSHGTLSFKQVMTGISVAILDPDKVKFPSPSTFVWRDQNLLLCFITTDSKQWKLMKDHELGGTPGIRFLLDRAENLLWADEHWDWFWQILDKLTDLLHFSQSTSFQSLVT